MRIMKNLRLRIFIPAICESCLHTTALWVQISTNMTFWLTAVLDHLNNYIGNLETNCLIKYSVFTKFKT